jgi:hypothetical protein
MTRRRRFTPSLEPLELRISLSGSDDPLPKPQPAPGPYPGDDPPIDHPELPPSGPVGPGSRGRPPR